MFTIEAELTETSPKEFEGFRGRAGVISTPHGEIQTPAFIPVATQATVRMVLPETIRELGAQALLANAYHLHLRPGSDLVAEAGGLGTFMNWPGPTFTDSGGFQVLSLGAGFKKTLAMDPSTATDDVVAPDAQRLAKVDDDGVTFRSHIDGSTHRFTPEFSMQVQHNLGADIIFAFDELTALVNTADYQRQSLDRTQAWALRCLTEHWRLQESAPEKSRQFLFGVVQGAQHEDLRREAARHLAELRIDSDGGTRELDGFGIGGAIDKSAMGQIIRWVAGELPRSKPRHLLGIGEPEDFFVGVENGCDTFDCVSPSRVARNSRVYSTRGRYNLIPAAHRRAFEPIDDTCECYTCRNYTRAYLHHLFRAKEGVAGTLATIHNEHFIVGLVAQIRQSVIDGTYADFKADFLGRYFSGSDQ